MEYIFPSMFNEQGVNIASPIIQSGGMGTNPMPHSFKYNGGSPQEAFQYNNYANNQYNYYQQLGQQSSQQLMQAQQIANPYYQQQPQYYNNGYVQNYNPYNPYASTYYQQQQPQTDYLQLYQAAYNSGQIGLSSFCYGTNGHLSYIDTEGHSVDINQTNPYDEWYGGAIYQVQKEQLQQQQQLQKMQEQRDAWLIVKGVFDRYNGIDDEQIQRNREEEVKKELYYQKWQKYVYETNQLDYQNDCIVNFVSSCPNSLQKGYMNPTKQAYVNRWNNCYNQKVEKYGEHYTLNDFLNNGIATEIMFDILDDESREREKQRIFSIDRNAMLAEIQKSNPGVNIGIPQQAMANRLNIDDMEIHVPPSLNSQEYIQRRNAFMNSIFSGLTNYANTQPKY